MSSEISVLTACLNNGTTLKDCLNSRQQFLPGAPHLIQDGGSTDDSHRHVQSLRDASTSLVTEKDDGLYDALNRLVNRAETGWLMFLHADDQLVYPNLPSDLQRADDVGAMALAYGVAYVNTNGRVYRSWRLRKPYRRAAFRHGFMLPHTGLVVRRELFERFGLFRQDLGSAADYEWILRVFYKGAVEPLIVPDTVLTHMRAGGASNANAKARLAANRYDRMAWQVNDLRPHPLLRLLKPLRKLAQFA